MRRFALALALAAALAGCKSEKRLTRAPSDAKALMAGPFAGYGTTQLGGGGVEGVTWSQAARLMPEGSSDESKAGMAMLQVSNHEIPPKPDANGIPRFGGPPIENATGVHKVDVQGITLYVGAVTGSPMATAKAAAWFVPFSNAHAIVYAADEKTATDLAGVLLKTWSAK